MILLKNILCIDKYDVCPINYIRVSKKPPIENIEDLKVIESSQINFYYSKNPYPNSTKIPYIANTFRIGDSSICALPNLYYSEIVLNDLEAAKKNYSSNCVLKDFSQGQTVDLLRYHKLDFVDNYALYEENEIIDKIKKKELDQYGFDLERYKNHSLYLYIRSHYGFNYTCLKEREKKSRYNTLDELQISYSKADQMIVWANIVFGLNFVPAVVSLFSFMTFYDEKEFYLKQLVSTGVSFYDLIYTLVKRKLDNAFDKEMSCSDIVTNDEYNVMTEKLRKSGRTIFLTGVFIGIQFALYGISILYQILSKTLKSGCFDKKQDEEPKPGIENIDIK